MDGIGGKSSDRATRARSGRRSRASAPAVRTAQAFTRYAGIDLMAVLPPAPPARFAAAARAAGVSTAADDGWGDVFSRVLVEKIEQHLGLERATVLCEYPVAQSPLARPTAGDPRLAERFELYACGIELANGFGELTDPAEQRRRFEAEMAEKQRVYGESYPIDEDFLAALAQMPEASGFRRFTIGIETGSPRMRKLMKKEGSVETTNIRCPGGHASAPSSIGRSPSAG